MLKLIAFLFVIFNFTICYAQSWSKDEVSLFSSLSINPSDPNHFPIDVSNAFSNHENAIRFGKSIFFDKRFSSNKQVSCSSCHIKEHAFTDNKKIAVGLREGFRNTSTLLNISAQDWFFADGAKDSLWAQVLSSIENPAEQNFTRMEVLQLVATDEHYKALYKKTFKAELPDKTQLEQLPLKAGPNAKLEDLIAWKKLNNQQREATNRAFTNIGKAIAAYVSTIKSEPSRFDAFVSDVEHNKISTQLNTSEQRGLRLFISQESGCINCHSGPLLSNKTFHNIATGIPGKDNGRSEVIESVIRDEFNCLSKYSDAEPEQCLELKYINRDKHSLAGAYKTSTLRSIGKTAPYMHDGRYASLKEVINHYESASKLQPNHTDLSPVTLTEEQKTDLVNFLLTL